MRYTEKEQLITVANVRDPFSVPGLTRVERLKRWAHLLDKESVRPLNTLNGTEYEPPETRNSMRVDNSPISVALADPRLRAEGLRSDTYGAAKEFFELTDRELHDILCYCHYGNSVAAHHSAASVHHLARAAEGRSLGARLRSIFQRVFGGGRSASSAAA